MDNETIKRKLAELTAALEEIPKTNQIEEARNSLAVANFWFEQHCILIDKKVRKHVGLDARR